MLFEGRTRSEYFATKTSGTNAFWRCDFAKAIGANAFIMIFVLQTIDTTAFWEWTCEKKSQQAAPMFFEGAIQQTRLWASPFKMFLYCDFWTCSHAYDVSGVSSISVAPRPAGDSAVATTAGGEVRPLPPTRVDCVHYNLWCREGGAVLPCTAYCVI